MRRYRNWRIAVAASVACSAQMASAICISAAPMVVPDISRSLGGTTVELAWVVASYAVAFGGLVLWGGRTADAIGSRRALALGFALMAVGALVSAIAPTVAVVVSGRILQGVGAALAVPGALRWINVTTEAESLRGRILAAFAASGAVGFGVGGLGGGIIADEVGWRSVFLTQGLLLVPLVLAAWFVESSDRGGGRMPSLFGAVLLSGALLTLSQWLKTGTEAGWAIRESNLLLGATFVLTATWVLSERTGRQPMIPLVLWRVSGLGSTLIGTALVYAAWSGTYYFGVQALFDVVNLDMRSVAVWLAPLCVAALLGSRLSALMIARFGGHIRAMILGAFVCAAGPFGASLLSTDSGPSPFLGVLWLAIFGQVVAFVAQSDLVLGLVGKEFGGLGGALFNAFCQVGAGVGIAVQAAFFNGGGVLERLGLTGYQGAFRGAALMAVGATLLALILAVRLRPTALSDQFPRRPAVGGTGVKETVRDND